MCNIRLVLDLNRPDQAGLPGLKIEIRGHPLLVLFDFLYAWFSASSSTGCFAPRAFSSELTMT